MKTPYTLLPLLAAAILFSCKPEDPYKQSIAAKEAELKSGTIIDTIFLGFRFGMTEDEYWAHCKDLLSRGKVKQTGGVYLYSLENAMEKLDVAFNPEFHDGGLFKLTLHTKPAHSVELAQLTFIPFARKYRGREVVIPKKFTACDSYDYYKGNLEISIFCTVYDVANMVYTDNRIVAKVEAAKQEAKEKARDDF